MAAGVLIHPLSGFYYYVEKIYSGMYSTNASIAS